MTAFEEKVLVSLSKLEVAMEQNDKDHVEIKGICQKIPAMEIGLNNHLASHRAISRLFVWPVTTVVVAGVILSLLRYLFHII